MGRRFYCDYCDKSFPNNPVNRRTHLNGIQHQQLRKLHYEQYLDPPQRLAIERAKKPCTTFLRTGECSYGLLCRFSHQTPDMIRRLEELAKEQLDSTSYLTYLVSDENITLQVKQLENIVRKRRQSQLRSARRPFPLPDGFEDAELPPSLRLFVTHS